MKLRNIKRVFYSNSADAPHSISSDTVRVVLSALTEIQVQPFPKLEISEKKEGGQRVYTVKLTLKTTDDTLASLDRKVFYALDINDMVWILGSKNRPYPIVTKSVSLPESAQDNQLNTFQIDYSSILPILYRPAT